MANDFPKTKLCVHDNLGMLIFFRAPLMIEFHWSWTNDLFIPQIDFDLSNDRGAWQRELGEVGGVCGGVVGGEGTICRNAPQAFN